MFKKYVFSSLVSESADGVDFTKNDDYEHSEVHDGKFKIGRLHVKTQLGADTLAVGIGKYSTVYFNRVSELDEESSLNLVQTVAREIKSFLPQNCQSIFIAGLGNRYLTSDTIGTKCVSKIDVTRHISVYNKELFDGMNIKKLSALSPGVMSQTGIETAEIIKGAVNAVCPDAVIAIDSLCARSPDRLASTVQISNCGISPGSGIGNKRKAISQSELHCPVIMLGVPTVVSSSTLVCDALEKANISDISPELENILENGRSYFVTVNEIDELTDIMSDILASAIFESAKNTPLAE